MSTLAQVRLWGSTVGVVSMEAGQPAVFQYDSAFLASGVELAPLRMPLRAEPYEFPSLNPASFHGLPGLLADSLPDRYGQALINSWLAGQARSPESMDAVARLCYIGRRGMGALEFAPAHEPPAAPGREIDVAVLVELASEVLTYRQSSSSLSAGQHQEALAVLLRDGTSAGGARAKALIFYNPRSKVVRFGDQSGAGFESWLLKFDGVAGNKDRERSADPQGFGAIELAYAQMARDAGITMTECRLLEENGRRHFMTRRFDRGTDGDKRHMCSLAALAHLDFAQPGAHSYEQVFEVMRALGLGAAAAEQQFRRTVFNVIARNQDDHVKNIAFLMDRTGRWELSPAFDIAYSYNPSGDWTARHQMSLAGKCDDFTIEDFLFLGRVATLKRGAAQRIIAEVGAVVSEWPRYAAGVDVDEEHIRRITPTLRLKLTSH